MQSADFNIWNHTHKRGGSKQKIKAEVIYLKNKKADKAENNAWKCKIGETIRGSASVLCTNVGVPQRGKAENKITKEIIQYFFPELKINIFKVIIAQWVPIKHEDPCHGT